MDRTTSGTWAKGHDGVGGLPGFVRARLPLLYRDDQLIAVANLPQLNAQAMSLIWTPPADARFELMGPFK